MSRSVMQTVLIKENEGNTREKSVRTCVGGSQVPSLDPFLLLADLSVAPPTTFHDHAHRGFETVQYVLDGPYKYEDFTGHAGILNSGDMQWTTAGRGFVHCERPTGPGVSHALQLWVNLAAKDKMVTPACQELLDKDIPRSKKSGVSVKIIAGEAHGIKSPVYTRTPTMYLDFTLDPGAKHSQSVPQGWTTFIYTLTGVIHIGGSDKQTETEAHTTTILSDGSRVDIENKGKTEARFVLIGGQPLKEPVVPGKSPDGHFFVMNTQEEIEEATTDHKQGRNGFENAPSWKSGN